LRLGKARSPGLESGCQLSAPFNIDGLQPFGVERPHEGVAFAEDQDAILPFQDDEAMLGLNNEALAEGLEVMNNRAGEPGLPGSVVIRPMRAITKTAHQMPHARRSLIIVGLLTMVTRTGLVCSKMVPKKFPLLQADQVSTYLD
jgi:hypothetical protein